MAAAVMAGLWLPLVAAERRMRGSGGPGIIGLELAGSWEAVQRIEADWGPQGRSAARMSLLWDFPFLVAYGAFWWLSARAASEALRDGDRTVLAALGRPAVLAALTAASCDLVENAALLRALGRGGRLPYPVIARRCALGKFVLLGFCVFYALVGAGVSWTGRRRAAPGADPGMPSW